MINYSNKTIVIVQTLDQLNYYLTHNYNLEDIILPIGPEVISKLDFINIKYLSLDVLLKNINIKVEEEKSLSLIEKTITDLNYFSSNLTDKKIEIGNYYSFQLWIILGQIHYNILIAKCIKELSPKKIILFSSKKNNKLYLKYRPNPDYLLSNVIINTFSKTIVFNQLLSEKSKKILNFRDFIITYLPTWALDYLKFLKNTLQNNYFKKFDIILIGGEHDWVNLKNSNLFTIRKLILFNPIFKKSNFSLKLKNMIDLSIMFDDKPAYNLNYLAKYIDSDILFFNKIHDKKLNIVKKSKAIVSSVFTYPEDNFFAHLGRKCKIPIIIWQHGEKGSFHDVTIPYTELCYATDYIAYGPSVINYFQSAYGTRFPNIKYHVCGNLSKISNRLSSDIILYATGKWLKTAAPISLNHRGEDLRILEIQKKILSFLNNSKINNDIIFKANNTLGSNILPENYNKYKNINIEYNTSFSELLSRAKILILDTPGTTLVEACSLNIPIFVVGNGFEYFDNFLNKIKKRVVWCNNAEDLIFELNNFLVYGKYNANLDDDDYYKSYCGFKDKNLVKEQLINIINKTISNEKKQ